MPTTDKWLVKTRLKTMLLFCGVLFSVFFVMSWTSYQIASRAVNQQIEDKSLPLNSNNIYSQIQRDLLMPMSIASMMAHDTFVRDWALLPEPPAAPMQRYLREINHTFATSVSFFILEKDGRYFLPDRISQVQQLPGDGSWYRALHELPLARHYRVDIGHNPYRPSTSDIYIDHLVYDYQGQQIGIAGVGLSMDKLRDLLTEYQQQYRRAIYFVDRHGQVMLQGHDNQLQQLSEREGITEVYRDIMQGKAKSVHFEDSQGRVYLNVRLVDEFDWYLVVEERDEGRHSPIHLQFLVNLAAAFTVTLVVLLVSWLTQSRFQHRLLRAAVIDPLTGASNRRAGDAIYQQWQKDSSVWPVALMMLDVDHFKQINDTYGHDVGDRVLKKLVEHCRTHIRQDDMLCRWGGEEFLLLFSQCPQDKAHELAERIRHGIELLPIVTGGKRLNLTVSAGMAMLTPEESLADGVTRADEALYLAKTQGRNRIIWWSAAN
ncbi:sensor domain-containing diguanylate cyclase [Shewanella sp. A3A]|nr:sensor domain-containing diguanylate cyclase [Shewanella ferrihydritica]